MHQQIRTKPTASPADLERLLQLLSKFNLTAAGGSNLELDGEFAFSVEHEEMDAAFRLLEDEGYKPYRVDVDECWLSDEPGELQRCIAGIAQTNLETSRVIKDLALGGPAREGPNKGRIPVQVYTIEVRTRANTPPGDQGTA